MRRLLNELRLEILEAIPTPVLGNMLDFSLRSHALDGLTSSHALSCRAANASSFPPDVVLPATAQQQLEYQQQQLDYQHQKLDTLHNALQTLSEVQANFVAAMSTDIIRSSTVHESESRSTAHCCLLCGTILDKIKSRFQVRVKYLRSQVKNLLSLVKNLLSLVKNLQSLFKNLRLLVKNSQSVVNIG